MAALPPNAMGWSVEQVKQWSVDVVGIKEEHADKLVQQEIDGEELMGMTKQDLRSYDIPDGPARKLMRAIEGLGGGGSSSVAGEWCWCPHFALMYPWGGGRVVWFMLVPAGV